MGDAGVEALLMAYDGSLGEGLRVLDLEYKALESGKAVNRLLLNEKCRLVELNLSRNQLGDAGVEQVCAGLLQVPATLMTLNLSDNQLTDASAPLLACLTGLDQLLVSKNTAMTQILDVPVKKLVMQECGLKGLGALNPGIRDLDVSGNAVTTLQGVDLGLLTKLFLARNPVKDLGTYVHHLHTLDLANNELPFETLLGLLQHSSIHHLSLLGSESVGDAGALEIATLIESASFSKSIQYLSLSGCGIMEPGAVRLFTALSKYFDKNSLSTLELGGNMIGTKGEEALLDLRAMHPSLDVARDTKMPTEEMPDAK